MTDYENKRQQIKVINERISMLIGAMQRNIHKRGRKTEELIEYAYGEFIENLHEQGVNYSAASKRRDKFFNKEHRKLDRTYGKRNKRIHTEIKRLSRIRDNMMWRHIE